MACPTALRGRRRASCDTSEKCYHSLYITWCDRKATWVRQATRERGKLGKFDAAAGGDAYAPRQKSRPSRYSASSCQSPRTIE